VEESKYLCLHHHEELGEDTHQLLSAIFLGRQKLWSQHGDPLPKLPGQAVQTLAITLFKRQVSLKREVTLQITGSAFY